MPILKGRLLTAIMLDPGIFWIVQLDVRAYIIEYQVTEKMLGILSARVPREVSKKYCQKSQIVWDFYMVTTLAGFTYLLLALGRVREICDFMLNSL